MLLALSISTFAYRRTGVRQRETIFCATGLNDRLVVSGSLQTNSCRQRYPASKGTCRKLHRLAGFPSRQQWLEILHRLFRASS
jgi:hypothetical protein